MTAAELLSVARTRGIVLRRVGETLTVRAPAGVVTPELREQLALHKGELLALLEARAFPCSACGRFAFPTAAVVCYWCRRLADRGATPCTRERV